MQMSGKLSVLSRLQMFLKSINATSTLSRFRPRWDVLAVFLPCVSASEEERDNLANPLLPRESELINNEEQQEVEIN
jgi:hypothetical protein